jgi:hypothetical protein
VFGDGLGYSRNAELEKKNWTEREMRKEAARGR